MNLDNHMNIGEDFTDYLDRAPKNEERSDAFIRCKHAINDATFHTLEAVTNYCDLYVDLDSDPIFWRREIQSMLEDKINEIMP